VINEQQVSADEFTRLHQTVDCLSMEDDPYLNFVTEAF
jgi:uncharacterized protein with ATP-grasp and redox domains